jgi:type VI protein secretion system component Hcp
MITRKLMRFVLLAVVFATAGTAARAQLIVACIGTGTDQSNPLVDNCGGVPGARMFVQFLNTGGTDISGRDSVSPLNISLGRNPGGDQLLQDLYTAKIVPTVVFVVYGPPVNGTRTPAYHYVLTNATVTSDAWGSSVGTDLRTSPSESLSLNFTSLEVLDDATGQKAVFTPPVI